MEKLTYVNPKISVSVKSSCSISNKLSDTGTSNENDSVVHPPELSREFLDSALPLQESFMTVPPTTPAATFSFEHSYTKVPRPFPAQDDLKLPYIREVGIKNCLDILGGYFNCEDYKLNLVKFWFLDVITDCLWKMQDEFQFPEPYQKIIVEWILYLMELIRDPHRNLSRKRFFQIFNEAMVISHEKVQAGCEFLPSPTDLFGLVEDEEEEISFPSSTPSTEECSSVSLTSQKSDEGSYLAVGIDENPQVFKMPKSQPKYCPQDDISGKISESINEEELICEEEITPRSSQLESIEFYQPDPNIPERFLSSSSSSSSFQSLPGEDDYVSPIQEERFKWKRDPLPLKKNCSDETLDIKKTSTTSGLQKPDSWHSTEMNVNQARKEWTSYLENRMDYVHGMEKNILINSCALFAIKQFVYDYFYETFQFTIVKLALMNSFSSITQNINTKWFVPKVLKEELKKPKPKKEKKKKKKKEKKGKKPKKKTKSKKDKKKKKKSKKDKKKKGKKKGKKEKKKKLTKAERDELARIKREQQRLEEELRKAEENRRLLFPLKDATTDEFFKSIFEHWVKPKGKKGKGKGKGKGKKGKKKK